MKNLLLARHATVEPFYMDKYVGRSDAHLGGEKNHEIHRLSETIKQFNPTAVVCSPSRRARETAEGVAHLSCFPSQEIQMFSALQEIDFGRWEGLTYSEIEASEPDLVSLWANWSEDFCFPEGERVSSFLYRVKSVANQLLAMNNDTILVVSHGGVIRAMLCHLLRLHPENYLLFDIKPARLTVIDLFPEGGMLSGLNL